MALSVEKGEQAGRLAAAIRSADEALSGLNTRISEGAQITSMIAQLANGNTVRAEMLMTAEESAEVFTAVRTIVQAKRNALANALAAIN